MKSKKISGKLAATPETTISSPVVSKATQAQLPLPPTEQQLVFDKITQPPLPTAAIAEPWVTAKAVLAHFGMCDRTLRTYVRDLDMPHHRIGERHLRFKISEVQAFLDKLHAHRFAAKGRASSLAEARKRIVVIPILKGLELLSETKATPIPGPSLPVAKPMLTPKCQPGRKANKPVTGRSCDSGHHRWRTSQYTRTCVDCGRTEERNDTNNWVPLL